jgi:hypothetical protein
MSMILHICSFTKCAHKILFCCLLFYTSNLSTNSLQFCGPGSSVGIVTDYGLDGSGIETRWGREYLPVHTGPWAHPASCTLGTGSFLGAKCGRGVLMATHPLLVPRSWKSRAIPLPTLWATLGMKWGYFTFTFLQFYIGIRKQRPAITAPLF